MNEVFFTSRVGPRYSPIQVAWNEVFSGECEGRILLMKVMMIISILSRWMDLGV